MARPIACESLFHTRRVLTFCGLCVSREGTERAVKAYFSGHKKAKFNEDP